MFNFLISTNKYCVAKFPSKMYHFQCQPKTVARFVSFKIHGSVTVKCKFLQFAGAVAIHFIDILSTMSPNDGRIWCASN